MELLAGDPQPVDAPRDDGSAQKVWRCPTCQVAVYSQYTRPQVRFVRGGTLDDPASVGARRPHLHAVEAAWVTLPESVPAVEIYYDTKTLWPAASLERLDALRG